MKKFSCGTELISGADSLNFLSTLGAKKVLLVTDKFFSQSGLAGSILSRTGCEKGNIFDEVQPDPPAALAAKGAAMLKKLQPDLLIALGGGSSLDCAKGILLAAEKRPVFVAIPTTSGTGSEVTSFSILTHDGVKHPLIDKAMRPDYAILDPTLLEKLPVHLIAESGMDAITHCVEAIAAKEHSLATDALAGEACRVLLEMLPRSYAGQTEVRGDIHLAATMAGLAFDNAGLGLTHALAHALGGAFHVPHGRLGGILLPYVMDFNKKICAAQYASLARMCGMGAATELLSVRNLQQSICRLRGTLKLPATLKEAGISPETLAGKLDSIADAAMADRCMAGNPRPVTPADVKQILQEAAR